MSKRAHNKQIETDVLVVGYGGAGAIAAMTAHDQGSRVILLEKMDKGGGATFLSNGGILVPLSMEYVDYLYAICAGLTDRDLLERFVEEAMKIEDTLRDIGGVFERWVSQEVGISFPPLTRPSWPKVPSGKAMARGHIKAYDIAPEKENPNLAERVRAVGRAYGPDLWRLMRENVERRAIPVMTNTPAKDLVKNEAGEVVGVVAESQGQDIFIRAKKAVVLTTGGFGANEAMRRAHLPCPFHYLGLSYAKGDGIVMSQKAGAAMWHMLGIIGQLGFKAPEFEAAFQTRIPSERFVFVDRHGKRFINETEMKLHNMWRAASLYDPERLIYPRIPCYLVFDEVTRTKAPVSRDWRPTHDYEWSLDNSVEIEKGWIKKGNTLAELAGQIGLDGPALEHTIKTFNESCRGGVDPDFGRAREMMGPIDTPPYYAIEHWPVIVSVSGGPRHDKESRVLDQSGKPIPRLYAAGELGSLFAWLYEAGGGLAECIVFGKIAGLNAAAEKAVNSW